MGLDLRKRVVTGAEPRVRSRAQHKISEFYHGS